MDWAKEKHGIDIGPLRSQLTFIEFVKLTEQLLNTQTNKKSGIYLSNRVLRKVHYLSFSQKSAVTRAPTYGQKLRALVHIWWCTWCR